MSSASHLHETAAFAHGLDRHTRLAAEEAWLACADLRALLSAVCAVGMLAADGRSTADAEMAARCGRQLRGVRGRLAAIDGLDRAHLDGLLAATADLERALAGVAEARDAGRIAPWGALVDCYAAMSELRTGLWAFELRPEGAPLTAAARATYDEGFRSGRTAAR